MIKKLQPIRYELFKTVHRSEIYIFGGILLLLSSVFAYLIGTDSNVLILSGTEKMGGMLFYIIVYSMLTSLLLFPITIISITAGLWANEFESGTMAYSIAWMSSRKYIFTIKYLETIALILVYNIFLILCSVLSFIYFGQKGQMYSIELLYGVKDQVIKFILVAIMNSFFLSALSTLCCMIGNTSLAIIVSVATIIIFRIFEQVDCIKEVIPTYVINPANVLKDTFKSNDLYDCIIYTVLISGGIYALAYYVFKRKNIK